MRRSLFVLNVGLLLPFNASVRQLLGGDGISSIVQPSASPPVPVESPNEPEPSHLLISQVGDDLEHPASVSIMTKHLVAQQTWQHDALLQDKAATEKSADHPFCILSTMP